MNKKVLLMLLLTLAVGGCYYGPGGGYGYRGGDYGFRGGDYHHDERHGEREQRGGWGR